MPVKKELTDKRIKESKNANNIRLPDLLDACAQRGIPVGTSRNDQLKDELLAKLKDFLDHASVSAPESRTAGDHERLAAENDEDETPLPPQLLMDLTLNAPELECDLATDLA